MAQLNLCRRVVQVNGLTAFSFISDKARATHEIGLRLIQSLILNNRLKCRAYALGLLDQEFGIGKNFTQLIDIYIKLLHDTHQFSLCLFADLTSPLFDQLPSRVQVNAIPQKFLGLFVRLGCLPGR